MISNVLQVIFDSSGDRIGVGRGTFKKGGNYTNVVQFVSPEDSSLLPLVNILRVDDKVFSEPMALALAGDGTALKGADVVDPTDPNYNLVADYNVWQKALSASTVSKVSNFRAGKLYISGTFTEYEDNTDKLITDKGKFGSITGDLPTSGTTGDYYECEDASFTSSVTGITYSYLEKVYWDGDSWEAGNNRNFVSALVSTQIPIDTTITPGTLSIEQDLTTEILATLASQDSRIVDNATNKLDKDFTNYPSETSPEENDLIAITDSLGENQRNISASTLINNVAILSSTNSFPIDKGTGLFAGPALLNKEWSRRVDKTTNVDYSDTPIEVPHGDLNGGWIGLVGDFEVAFLAAEDVGVFDGDYTDFNYSLKFFGHKTGGNGAVRQDFYKVASDGTGTLIAEGVPIAITNNSNEPLELENKIIAGTFNIDKDAGERFGIVTYAKRDTAAATTLYGSIMGDPVTSYTIYKFELDESLDGKQDKQDVVIGGKVATINNDGSGEESTINLTDVAKKSVYDTDDNGIVDDSEKLNGQLPSFYAQDSLVEKLANKDQASGYLGLDALSGISVVAINASGDVVILGNLDVRGATTKIETLVFEATDNVLLLNKDQIGTPSSGLLSGIEVERGDETNYQFLFEELTTLFKIGTLGNLQAVATREDVPLDGGMMIYDNSTKRLISREFLGFTELPDTPSDYTGFGRYLVKVNAAETGLEFSRENNNSSTGIEDADTVVPSVNGGNTTQYDLGAGIIKFVDNTVSPPQTNLLNYVGLVGASILGIATRDRTYLAINSGGTITELGGFPTEAEYRTLVIVAIAYHPDRVNIQRIDPIGWIATQPSKNAIEAGSFIPSNKIGNEYTWNGDGTNLSIDASIGQMRILGGNRVTNPNNPNITSQSVSEIDPFTILYRDGTGGITWDDNGGSFYTVVDPTWFDDGTGILGTNPGNNSSAVINRIFRSPRSGKTFILLGQSSYATISTAIVARQLGTDILSGIPSFIAEDLVFRTYFTVRKAATDFSDMGDAEFFNTQGDTGTVAGGVVAALNDTQVSNTSVLGDLAVKLNQKDVNELAENKSNAKTRVLIANNPSLANFNNTTNITQTIGDIYIVQFPSNTDDNVANYSTNGGTTPYDINDISGADLHGHDVSLLTIPLKWDGTNYIDYLNVTALLTPVYSANATYTETLNQFPAGTESAPMKANFKGLTLDQLVLNGDFDGTTNWSGLNATINESSNIMSVTGDGTDTDPSFRQTVVDINVGDTYGVYIKTRVTNAVCLSIALTRPFSSTIAIAPTQDQFIEVFVIGTATLDETFRLAHNYADAGIANGKVMEVEQVMLFNMTALGIESFSEAQMLDIARKGYFEGLQDSVPSLITYGKNLINLTDSFLFGLITSDFGTYPDGIRNEDRLDTISATATTIDFTTTSLGFAGYVSPVIRVKRNDDIVVSFNVVSGKTPKVSWMKTDSDGNPLATVETGVTTINVGEFDYIKFGLSDPDTGADTIILNEVQLEQGTVATDYIPYQSNEFKPEITLRSVPNVADELNNYDASAIPPKQRNWLNDWVHNKNTDRDFNDVVQNATSWSVSNILTNTQRFNLDLSSLLDYKFTVDNNSKANIIVKIGDTTYTNVTHNVNTSVDSEWQTSISNTGIFSLRVDKTTYPNTASFEAYLQANDVDFRYEVETPIVTELPELDQVFSFEDGWLEQNGVLNNEITFSVATNFNAKVDAIGKAVEEMDDRIGLTKEVVALSSTIGDYTAINTSYFYINVDITKPLGIDDSLEIRPILNFSVDDSILVGWQNYSFLDFERLTSTNIRLYSDSTNNVAMNLEFIVSK